MSTSSEFSAAVMGWLTVAAIAVLVELGQVVWDLRQTKALGFTQVVHGDVDNVTDTLISICEGGLNQVLATACCEPEKLVKEGGFVLDAYFNGQSLCIQ